MQTPLTRELQCWLGDPLDGIVAIPFRTLHGRSLPAVSSMLRVQEEEEEGGTGEVQGEGERRRREEQEEQVKVRISSRRQDEGRRRGGRLPSRLTPYGTRGSRGGQKELKATTCVSCMSSVNDGRSDQGSWPMSERSREVGRKEEEQVQDVRRAGERSGERRKKEGEEVGKDNKTLFKHLKVQETSHLKRITTDPSLMRRKNDEFTIMMRQMSHLEATEEMERQKLEKINQEKYRNILLEQMNAMRLQARQEVKQKEQEKAEIMSKMREFAQQDHQNQTHQQQRKQLLARDIRWAINNEESALKEEIALSKTRAKEDRKRFEEEMKAEVLERRAAQETAKRQRDQAHIENAKIANEKSAEARRDAMEEIRMQKEMMETLKRREEAREKELQQREKRLKDKQAASASFFEDAASKSREADLRILLLNKEKAEEDLEKERREKRKKEARMQKYCKDLKSQMEEVLREQEEERQRERREASKLKRCFLNPLVGVAHVPLRLHKQAAARDKQLALERRQRAMHNSLVVMQQARGEREFIARGAGRYGLSEHEQRVNSSFFIQTQ